MGGSIRSTDAGPVPGGCPASPSAAGATGSAGGCWEAGGGAPDTGGSWDAITCTAAWPRRAPTRASMSATPPPTAVTVPSLSIFATARLFEDQMNVTVGITLPARSNAVASSAARSPTLIVTEGGAT